jgi:hypothetical protein
MSRPVPIRYVRKNVIFGTDGTVAAFYKLPTVSYALLPDEDKWAWMWTIAGLALRIDAHISIYRMQRRWPTDGYIDQAKDLLDSRYADMSSWENIISGHVPRINSINSYSPQVFLRVSMKSKQIVDKSHSRLRSFDQFYRNISEEFGAGLSAPLMEREIQAHLTEQERILDRIRRYFPDTDPISFYDLQWMCLRAPMRHLSEPAIDYNWKPNSLVSDSKKGLIINPCSEEFIRLFDAPIDSSPLDHIIISSEKGKTYQSFLVLGDTPENIEFPGSQAEMMFRPLDGKNPVDAVMHCNWLSNKEAIAEVDKAILDAENAVGEEMAGQHRPDDRKMFNPELARALKTYLQHEEHPPMFNRSLCFSISASSEEELTRRKEDLRDRFSNVLLHLPIASQENLYYDCLPNSSGGKLRGYREMTTVERIGMTMPIATREAGDSNGVYIGYAIAGGRPASPILIDLRAAARNSLPPTIYAVGRQGSGKTFLALYLAFLSGKSGSYVITADPKPDHNVVSLFPGESQTLTLAGNEKYRGMLDPLIVTPRDLREDIALSYYLDILPIDRPGSWQIELMKAITTVMNGSGGSLEILNKLSMGNQNAKDVGEALEAVSRHGLGILGFGDGTNVRKFKDIQRITTISTAGLELPSPDAARSTYDWREQISVATFKIVAAYIMWLGTQDSSVHKTVVLDEAKFLPPAMLEKLVRMGRKHNITVIVISQTVVDLGLLKELISMYFICGMNSVEEAGRGLGLIGLDQDDISLKSKIADKLQFQKGRCFFRDMHGRVVEAQIDAVYQEIIDALNTAPPDLRKEMSRI